MTDTVQSPDAKAWTAVRRVDVDRPWRWLERGWADMRAHPGVSIGYGVGIVAVSIAMAGALEAMGLFWHLILPLVAGFMFMGPIVAIGLYETSRRREVGEPVSFAAALAAFKANPENVSYMGLLLGLFMLAWIRIATLLVALFFSTNPTPGLHRLIDMLVLSEQSVAFLAVGTAIGGLLAAIVFALGVVSSPMLLHRRCGVFEAVLTSVKVARANPKPLALWAGLIVTFTLIGLLPFFLGLAVTLPLIGHATWHAYRDLVGD